tara:strand:+ start:1252 stop:2034 length:783 start_codon:yes stop_codon:yes gene_type:complete
MTIKNKILKFYKRTIFTFKKKVNLDIIKIDINNLNDLFNHFGSDKGTGIINPYAKKNEASTQDVIGHGYGKFYEEHLSFMKNEAIKIMEIGTWKGASVAAFYFYFNKAKIYCLDRNFKFKFKSKRVKFLNSDTTNINELKKLEQSLIKEKVDFFDIIIDDSSHIYSDILKNLSFFLKKVKPGGYYVIEDYNHYKFYPELNNSFNESLEIEDILKFINVKKYFTSNLLDKTFQKYCFDSISKVIINKGIQKDSFIVFIKKK